MPRPIWSGSISFGLVSVPVRMCSATESKELRFHFLHKQNGTLNPIGYDSVVGDSVLRPLRVVGRAALGPIAYTIWDTPWLFWISSFAAVPAYLMLSDRMKEKSYTNPPGDHSSEGPWGPP